MKPHSAGGDLPSHIPSHAVSINTPCRNILIHGFCKYADKGCIFTHDLAKPSVTPTTPVESVKGSPIQSKSTPVASSPPSKKKFNIQTPSFTPSGADLSSTITKPLLPPNVVKSTSFVPQSLRTSKSVSSFDFQTLPTFTPSASASQINLNSSVATLSLESSARASPALIDFSNTLSDRSHLTYSNDMLFESSVPPSPLNGHSIHMGNIANFPVQYQLYAPEAMSAAIQPNERLVHDYFMSSELRELLQRKNEVCFQNIPNSTLPPFVGAYQSLVPLDISIDKTRLDFGHTTWLYKALSNIDGNFYTLRRIEDYIPEDLSSIDTVMDKWKNVDSPYIANIYDCFPSDEFNEESLIFVYDFCPLSKTLQEHHFLAKNPVNEQILWNYVVQILLALSSIHKWDLAARVIDAKRVLLLPGNKIKLNSLSIFDVINFHADSRTTQELQRQDFQDLGSLLISLACSSISAPKQLEQSLKFMSTVYSEAFISFVTYLMHAERDSISSKQLISQITPRVVDFFRISQYSQDTYQSELLKALENSRSFRVLTKLGFTNSRSHNGHDKNWSEGSARYILSLFRDYIFHQVDENGNPVIDLSHVLECLRKVDAGTDEKILLVSRNEKNCFIIKYKQLKECIELSMEELSKI